MNAVSLFTGCGGSDKGLTDAGFRVLMANDILPYAKDVYEANLPETDFVIADVAKIKNFPQADILVGCYPCQGYSQGGRATPTAVSIRSTASSTALSDKFGQGLLSWRTCRVWREATTADF